MYSLEDLAVLYFNLGIITIPLTIWIVYTTVTELLDLIFNNGRINEMLKHSDNLKIDPMEKEFEIQKEKRSSLNISNLNDVKRQMEFSKLQLDKDKMRYSLKLQERENIVKAKALSDIFKIDK